MSTWSSRTRLARDQRRPDGFFKPCLLTASKNIPTGPEWQFEVKHDGYRMIARVDGDAVRIWSRHGRNWTNAFPSVVDSLHQLGVAAVIDGEAVCQLEDGRSDFHALAGQEGCSRAVLWAFDMLMVGGEDLRGLPLEIRRERLERLLAEAEPEGIAFSDHQDGDGAALYAAACRMGLEGIVAKRKGTPYVSGRSTAWLKIKNPEFARPGRSG